jgi:hypothetical protein
MKEPKIGETYYAVKRYKKYADNKYITVDKVGRKYFQAGGLKFDKVTFLQYNGEYSPDYDLYDDEQTYNLKVKAEECWDLIIDRFYQKMTYEEIIELHNKLYERYYGKNKSV